MSEATEILLQINLVFWLIYGIAFLVAILYLAVKVRGLVRHINERVTPITKQVEDTVSRVTGAAQTVADQAQEIAAGARSTADHVAATARNTVDHVAHRVESASEVLRDTVVAPAIGINSVIAGARKAAEVLRERWVRRSEGGKDQSSPGEG